MRHMLLYEPKRLDRAPAPLPLPAAEPGEPPRYSLYILPEGARTIEDEDLSRFPPSPLGEEAAARAWLARAEGPAEEPGDRRGFWLDLAYYVLLAALVVGAFLFRGVGGGQPVSLLGFSAMQVLTTSMGEELPQGSLIVVRSVDPNSLKLGDDITYLAGQNTTITHRIIDITENYSGSGQRAFLTQGVANSEPDSLRIPAANVVGKVIFHSLYLGLALGFVRDHWIWLAVLLVLGLGLMKALGVVSKESGWSGGKRSRAHRPQKGRR